MKTEQVIVGSHEGSLQLWNISTNRKLYEFKGWGSPVSSCVSSPALDVIAVGCADGRIHVHNIRYNEEIVTFSHSMRGAVTALSFSTGSSPYLYGFQVLTFLISMHYRTYFASVQLKPHAFSSYQHYLLRS